MNTEEYRDPHPYDDKTVAEIVHDYVVVRGDLSEQYARDQLASIMDRRVDRALAAAVARAEAAEDWKAQALPVISGLQELGKALGLRLGTSITGPEATEAARSLKSRADAAEAKVDEVLRRIGRNLAQQHMAAERHQRAGLDDRHRYSEYHRMAQGRWAFYESARLLCQETRRDFEAFLSEHDPRHEEYDR